MALDDNTEDAAYAAIRAVCQMIRADQRERILKFIVTDIMVFMKWDTVTLKREEPEK